MTATAEFRAAVLRKCRESAEMKERFFAACSCTRCSTQSTGSPSSGSRSSV